MFDDDDDIESDLLSQISSEMRSGMPELIIGYEGHKTIIRNFSSLSKVFNREANHLAKYISTELGSRSSIKGNQLHISKQVNKEDLKIVLQQYTTYYITCSNCGKPDTLLSITRSKTTKQCLACGYVKDLE